MSNWSREPSEGLRGTFWRDGKGRLRLWGRIAIVFLAVSFIWIAIVEGLGPLLGPAYSDRSGHMVRAILVCALVVPVVILARRFLDRRAWEGLRFTSLRVGWRPLLFGMGFWLVVAGTGLMMALAFGWTSVSLNTPSIEILLLALYLPLLVFLFEALPEELIFRGYFYRNLVNRYPRWFAVVSQAVLFTLFGTVIGAAGSVDRVILFFTFSIVLGVLRAITNSLWASVGFHLIFQWVSQFNAAATRSGFVSIEGQPAMEVVAFWMFPIVLGSIVLVVVSVLRGHTGWRERDPDTPGKARAGLDTATSSSRPL